MGNSIKLGIIGVGRMGLTHYSIINTNPNVEINSIVDHSSTILSFLEKYLRINTYKDDSDFFEIEMPNAILVCTPPDLHYPIVKKAAKKNIHVFVEKPFTTNYENAIELANIYIKNGLINQVGYVNRFNDIFCKVKELISYKAIGEIIRFKSEMFSCTISKPEEKSTWRSSHESGGGALFEMASHAIDLVVFLIGMPDKVVGSSLNYIFSKKVEDSISSTLLYQDGKSGTIYVNWSDHSYRKPTNKIEIFGTEGKIIADQHSLKLYLNKCNKELKFHEGWNSIYITDIFNAVPFYVRGNEFTRQLYHFIDCILNREMKNQCTFKNAADTMSIIENIYNDYFFNNKFNNGKN